MTLRVVFVLSIMLTALPIVFAACSDNTDAYCMNKLAVSYTNAIRRKAGLPPLAMGSKAMLSNAMQHNKVMASRNNLFHQQLGNVVIGTGECRGTLSGENIAYNFVRQGSDAAAMCVKQWEKSPGHYRNIVNRNNRNVIVAVWVASNKQVWCTQTFSTTPTGGSGMCATPGGGGGGGGGGGDMRNDNSRRRNNMSAFDYDDDDMYDDSINDLDLVKKCRRGRCKLCEPEPGGRCWWL